MRTRSLLLAALAALLLVLAAVPAGAAPARGRVRRRQQDGRALVAGSLATAEAPVATDVP